MQHAAAAALLTATVLLAPTYAWSILNLRLYILMWMVDGYNVRSIYNSAQLFCFVC